MSLLALQRSMRDHILAGASEPPEGVAASAERGLAVYRHAYRAQLVANLRDTFEKTWAWLGDEAFDDAALAHVEAHAPRAWTLADYGFDFADTLAGRYSDDPEVAELAWLDWTLRRAFDGFDAEPISPEMLARVDWETAVLTFVPTLAIGKVVTNSPAIWGALADEETPPAVERLPAPAAIRVWRQGLSPQYRSIELFEMKALDLAAGGASFAELCADMAGDDPPELAVQRVGGLLGAWLQDGLIDAVRS
jgi:hypothetical protein